ncbi:MAG: DNA repair protein RadC [Myxococcales bacterium]
MSSFSDRPTAIICSDGRVRSSSSDRPRERLDTCGPSALADAELLALVLRTGDQHRDAWSLARSILQRFGGLPGLAGTSAASLEAMPGLGPAKSASLCASVELAKRLVDEPLERGQPIRSPEDIQRHFRARLRDACRESFHVLMLDGRHRLIRAEEVSVGTLTASLVHPREVFREAIRCASAAVVLVHNHPSGDPTPSAEDRSVTERLRDAGLLLGIRVLDHVIVTRASYFSFREAGESFGETGSSGS